MLANVKSLLDPLTDLLIDSVNSGASVGFLPPLSPEQARDYWQNLGEDIVLFTHEHDGRVAGTVQLQLAGKANGTHRAEVAKLLVHSKARRQGIGRQLMLELEEYARQIGRTTLVLDTRQGDVSELLYQQLGYIKAGAIPEYARSASGELHATALYYKLLS